MKKFLLSACLLATSSLAAFAAATQTITVNGQTVEGKMVTQITFSGDQATLTFDDSSTQTEAIDLINIAFAYTADGIGRVNLFEVSGIVDGNLQISGLNAGTTLRIYDTTGRSRAAATATQGVTSVDVSRLSSGVYIVRAGKQVIKFMKK